MSDKKDNNIGCLQLLAVLGGFFILFNPAINPFIEYKYINGEEYLTNSSWLVLTAMLAGYVYLLWIIFVNKKQ